MLYLSLFFSIFFCIPKKFHNKSDKINFLMISQNKTIFSFKVRTNALFHFLQINIKIEN